MMSSKEIEKDKLVSEKKKKNRWCPGRQVKKLSQGWQSDKFRDQWREQTIRHIFNKMNKIINKKNS